MKKLLIGVLAALCCLAITAPVIAETKVGGMVQTDVYYWEKSKERNGGGIGVPGLLKNTTTVQDDWSTTRINMPQAFNRLWVDYTSDDKSLRGYLQLRTGGQKGTTNENNFDWEYAYIDWHLNKAVYLRLGRQDQTFASFTPAQFMGHVDGHIVALGFGNVHITTRDAVKAYIKPSDNVRIEVQLLDPNTELPTATTTELTLPRQVGLAGAALESNEIPRFDLAVNFKFGNFQIEPGFTYLKQSYDQVAAGCDDSYSIWGLSLGMKAGFGPFTLSGEVTYGENLGTANTGGNYLGSANGAPVTYVNTGGFTRIEDGKTLAAWIQGEFNFGPAAIQLVIGRDKGENDGDPAIARDASEWERVQWMYGLNVPIFVAKNFTIVPQIWFYDYDGDAKIGGIAGSAARSGINTDFGSETMVGVTFQLTF